MYLLTSKHVTWCKQRAATTGDVVCRTSPAGGRCAARAAAAQAPLTRAAPPAPRPRRPQCPPPRRTPHSQPPLQVWHPHSTHLEITSKPYLWLKGNWFKRLRLNVWESYLKFLFLEKTYIFIVSSVTNELWSLWNPAHTTPIAIIYLMNKVLTYVCFVNSEVVRRRERAERVTLDFNLLSHGLFAEKISNGKVSGDCSGYLIRSW